MSSTFLALVCMHISCVTLSVGVFNCILRVSERLCTNKQTWLHFQRLPKAFSLKIFAEVVLALIQSVTSVSPPHLPSIFHLIHHQPLQTPSTFPKQKTYCLRGICSLHTVMAGWGWMCQEITGLCKQTGLCFYCLIWALVGTKWCFKNPKSISTS